MRPGPIVYDSPSERPDPWLPNVFTSRDRNSRAIHPYLRRASCGTVTRAVPLEALPEASEHTTVIV